MKILFRIFRIITHSFLKPALSGIWALFIAVLILIAIDFLLTSRHQIAPGESAIIREVWQRTNGLIGPVAYPFRVRSVENKTERVKNFLIQPFPFGIVEEVLKTAEPRSFSGKFALWTRDTITGKPTDQDTARVCVFKGQFLISQLEVYARALDQEAATNASGGRVMYRNREETLSKNLEVHLEDFLTTTVSEVGSDLQWKYLYLSQIFQPMQKSTLAFKKDFFWRNPWLIFDYKLRIQDIESVREIASTSPEIYQKLQELQARVDEGGDLSQLDPQLVEEINAFLGQYLRKNPTIYQKERWEYALDYANRDSIKTTTDMRRYIHIFIEKDFASLQKDYWETLQTSSLASELGIELQELNFEIIDEPVVNYPFLLFSN